MTSETLSFHPSAVIDENADLAEGVTIHPFVVIEKDVQVGRGTELLAGTVLRSGTRVGANCRLGPYASIGGDPMDSHFGGEASFALLEDHVQVRDFASVHRATGEAEATRVGRGSVVMSYAHVSHNAQVGRDVTLTTQVQLGGHVTVGDYAFLGAGAMVHQFCQIGAYAMVGASAAVNRDILPFSLARGDIAKHYRLNKVGLERRGITGERYKSLERAIRAFRKRDWASIETLAQDNEDVRHMLAFKTASRRGLSSFV